MRAIGKSVHTDGEWTGVVVDRCRNNAFDLDPSRRETATIGHDERP
jgi:hypothetical protein